MFVGGEFYTDSTWLLDAPAPARENACFLNGGTACLTVISDYLLDHGIGKVLLPSYLCPSIMHTFERCGLAWDFYQVDHDLSIDLADLTDKLTPYHAVYFINYFGFAHGTETRKLFAELRQNSVLLIEDNAQAGFSNPVIGDFAFNSIRKLAPFDGGYLTTSLPVAQYLGRYTGLANRRLPLIRAYREGLYRYLFDHAGSFSDLRDLYRHAEEVYETDVVVLGDEDEFRQIQRLDWQGIRQARRDNYTYLMNWVTSIPEIEPIFPELQADNMPFGLPVYISGVSRDWIQDELGSAGIGLTAHWDEIRSDPRSRGNPLAIEMAGKILTLPIDQRLRRKQLDYLAEKLIRVIREAKAPQEV